MKIVIEGKFLKIIDKEILRTKNVNSYKMSVEYDSFYNDRVLMIYFKQDDVKKIVTVGPNNIIDIPHEVLENVKDIYVGFYSPSADGDKLKDRYCSNFDSLTVIEGAYDESATPTEELTQTILEKYLQEMKEFYAESLKEYNDNADLKLSEYNNNSIQKVREYNENAHLKKEEIDKVADEVSKDKSDIEEMKKSIETSEINVKTSEANAKTSEQNAQKSAENASKILTNVTGIQTNINETKGQIDTIKEGIDAKAGQVNTAVEEATNQANESKKQAGIATTKANQTSADRTAVEAIKSDVSSMKKSVEQTKNDTEQIKRDTQTIFDNTVQAKKETLEAKETVENSLENERIESDKKYARAIESDEIVIEESGQVELDEDGYMKDVEISTSKDITQDVRLGYNKLNLKKYPYDEVQSILNGSTVTLNEGILSIDATSATADVTVKSKSLAWANRDIIPAGKYYFGVNTNGYYESNPEKLVQLFQGVVEITENYYLSQWYTTCKAKEKIDKKLLLSDDVSKTEYEQFGASPSIEFPSKIKNIESNIKINNHQLNCLENQMKSQTLNGLNFNINNDKSISIKGTATVRTEPHVWDKKDDNQLILRKGVTYWNLSGRTLFFNVKKNTYLTINNQKSYTPTEDTEIEYSVYFRFEKDETVDEIVYPFLTTEKDGKYEPFNGGLKKIELENQFLGSFKGYKNYIEKNRFKRNLNILNLTGSEKWQAHINSDYLKTPDESLDFFIQVPSDMKTNSIMLCDKFKFNDFDGRYRSNSNVESISNGGGYRRIYIRIKKDRLDSSDVDGLKKFLKELYEKGDPVKILYITNTEYDDELPAEILDKLNSFNVYKGKNQIDIYNFKLKFKSNKSISSFVDEQLKINSELQKKEFEEQAKAIEHHIIGVSNELERVKNDILETGEISNSYIHVEDSTMAEMQSLKADGACKQETTTGKNLWNYITNFVASTSGLNTSLSADGTITVTGVPTTNYTVVSKEIDITDALEDGETYTLVNENMQVYLYPTVAAVKIDGSGITYYISSSTNKSFKVDKSIYNKYVIRLTTNTLTNWGTDSRTIKTRVMLYKGNGDDSFEPYTGGIPAPNPDYPKAISTITGRLKVTSCGKNLLSYPFRETTKTSNGITWTDNKDGTITADGTATADASFAVTYSLPMPSGTFIYKTFGLPNDCKANYYFSGTRFGEATGMTVRTAKWNAGLIITIPKGVTVSNALLKPILVAGMIVGEYEQYISSQIVASLPENEFIGKINDEKKDKIDIVYNENDGKYHCILKKNLGKVEYSNYKEFNTNSYNNDGFQFVTPPIEDIDTNYIGPSISNYLRLNEGITASKKIRFSINYKLLETTSSNTRAEQKSAFENLMSKKNLIIIYPLATEREIDLGVVDMPLTYNNVTNIFTDSDLLPTITVKYYKNFKKTIEDLRQQNSNLQTQINEIKALLNTTNTSALLLSNLENDLESEVK